MLLPSYSDNWQAESEATSDARSDAKESEKHPSVKKVKSVRFEDPEPKVATTRYTSPTSTSTTYANFHAELDKKYGRRVPDDPSHSAYSGVLESNDPDYTSNHLSIRWPPQIQEELFAKPSEITVSHVPQWLWTQDQCRTWLRAVCFDHCAFTIAKVEWTSRRFTGGGRELYLISSQDWQVMMDSVEDWALVQLPLNVRWYGADVGKPMYIYKMLHCTSCRREIPNRLRYKKEKKAGSLRFTTYLNGWKIGPKIRAASF